MATWLSLDAVPVLSGSCGLPPVEMVSADGMGADVESVDVVSADGMGADVVSADGVGADAAAGDVLSAGVAEELEGCAE
ncbi:hypothetical protein RCH21_002097 [Arthrobacter sp. PL16]|uniref:hypothetical protein n=1 Tax=Arthrobacter sp. PL16 TaxID=3071720 RepID=UPI002E0BAFD5|nr:hypothetical protein [Arthrobacter sp. PL16]